jgi:hypothetical protein
LLGCPWVQILIVLRFMLSSEDPEVEQLVIQCNGPIGKVEHSGWPSFQEYELLLYVDVESIVELVDVHQVIIVEVCYNPLEFSPVCRCQVISLSNSLKHPPCYLLGICLPESPHNCGLEFLLHLICALFLSYGGFDQRPSISSTPQAGVVDPLHITVKLIWLIVELQLTLHDEGMELRSFTMVLLWIINLWIAGCCRVVQLLEELLQLVLCHQEWSKCPAARFLWHSHLGTFFLQCLCQPWSFQCLWPGQIFWSYWTRWSCRFLANNLTQFP